MFFNIYKQVLKDLTRRNRKKLCELSKSILMKGENSQRLSKKEKELIKKIDNFILRAHFEDDTNWTRYKILDLCSKIYDSELQQLAAHNFVMDATKQSASEKAQLECMESRGYKMEKMSVSGENSLRFSETSNSLVHVKVEGETSRSFDYKRVYLDFTEYFFGKVCFSQGGHQNSVKSELVNFLKSSIEYLKNNPNSNLVFTALVDGDSLTEENLKEYQKYTSKRVRLVNCDSYQPFEL
jgi:hypothetical protein